MSRYSPTVLPSSSSGFADSIAEALAQRQQRKRQAEQDRMAGEDRSRTTAVQDYTLGRQGIHLLSPPGAGNIVPQLPPSPVENLRIGATEPGQNPAVTNTGRFQYAPGMYVDTEQRATNQREEQLAAFQQEVAKAMATATGQTAVLDATAGRNERAYSGAGLAPGMAGAAAVNPALGAALLKPEPAAPHYLPSPDSWMAVTPGGVAQPVRDASGRPVPVQAPTQYSFGTGVTPGGEPVIVRQNSRTGTVQPTGVAAPAGAGGAGGGAMGRAVIARLGAARAEMQQADARMRAFEAGLAGGQASLSGGEQVLGSLAQNLNPAQGMVTSAISTMAMSRLQRDNPALAQYLRDAMSFAEGEQLISQRPSDFRQRITQFLAGARSGAQPQHMAPIQQRRTAILGSIGTALQGSTNAVPVAPVAPDSTGGAFDDLVPQARP